MEQKLPLRNEIPEELTWRLEDIFPDTAAWEKDLNEMLSIADEIAAMESCITDNAQNLLKAMRLFEKCMLKTDRVYGYAHMKNDEDTGNADSQELFMRAQKAYAQIGEKTAFIEPAILAVSVGICAAFPPPCIRYLELSLTAFRIFWIPYRF